MVVELREVIQPGFWSFLRMEGLSQAVVGGGGVSVSQEELGPGASSPLAEKLQLSCAG